MTTNGQSRKKVLLGVCGGIAAYKCAELIRLFKKSGADVQVLMTRDAARFVTPLTLGTLSEHAVLSEIFPENEDGAWTKHVELGLWADIFVIAPATAQTIAKLANGFSDSMLTATVLAARCPVLVCPAMDHDMFVHPATQANLETIESFGYEVMPPGYGALASGLEGLGRLPEPEDIFQHAAKVIDAHNHASGPLTGKTVLISAGPTREALDPVRFLSNHSTGTMGFELAKAARDLGASVTLVSGPVNLPDPVGIEVVSVVTADEMFEAADQNRGADIIVMAAAVADYKPAETSTSKLKKTEHPRTIQFERTKDILAHLGRNRREGQIIVGFALETDNALENAQRKLEEKNADIIVLNKANEVGAGFGGTTNRVTLLLADGTVDEWPQLPKELVARRLFAQLSTDYPQPEQV